VRAVRCRVVAIQIKRDLAQELALDGPGVAAVRQPHLVRCLVMVLFRDPTHSPLRIDCQVRVA
jgi:hypothetical protein